MICLTDFPSPLALLCPAGEEALYEEDLGEEEVAQELVPVAAQLAYVAARSAPLLLTGAALRWAVMHLLAAVGLVCSTECVQPL